MRRYRITYRDEDPCSPHFAWHCRAENKEHAVEQFLDGPDADGWEILTVVVAHTPQISVAHCRCHGLMECPDFARLLGERGETDSVLVEDDFPRPMGVR